MSHKIVHEFLQQFGVESFAELEEYVSRLQEISEQAEQLRGQVQDLIAARMGLEQALAAERVERVAMEQSLRAEIRDLDAEIQAAQVYL